MKFFWPFRLTAASRGRADRQQNHPSAGARVLVKTNSGTRADREVVPFISTSASDAEEKIELVRRRWLKRSRRTKALGQNLLASIRICDTQLAAIGGRYADVFFDIPADFGPRASAMFIATLSVAEYAFNLKAFNEFYALPDSWASFGPGGGWQLYAVSLIPSLMLPLAGHVFGLEVRRSPKWVARAVAITLAVSSAACVILPLAVLRSLSYSDTAGAEPDSGDMLAAMILINAAFFATSALVSFLSAPPDKERAEAHKAFVRLSKRREKLGLLFARLAGRHNADLASTKSACKAILARSKSIRAEYVDFAARIENAQPVELAEDLFWSDIDWDTELSISAPDAPAPDRPDVEYRTGPIPPLPGPVPNGHDSTSETPPERNQPHA